ncbi:MAG: RNA-binding transcriptional accessory protein [Firmicutes bacterium]|nr:RNA-binding transcriptional accessory protein [Bacillota bacterium]
MDIIKQISEELKLRPSQVEQTIKLLDEGNTIPFIARYRKEATGELDEVVLRNLADRLTYLRNLVARKEEVTHLIAEQDKLTDEIMAQIKQATTLQQLEDIYRPFRPKRRTRASIAKEKGLEPLADQILAQTDTDIQELAAAFLTDEVPTIEEALQGASDILAEYLSDDPKIRELARHFTWHQGIIVSELANKEPTDQDLEFSMYFDYNEPVHKIPPHRILAINRGERLKSLKVKIVMEPDIILENIAKRVITKPNSPSQTFLKAMIEDSYQRLLAPSIEREIRNRLTETAEEHSISIFAKNLHSLLMQAPVRNRNILGLDPAYRTGCKIVVINHYGDVLDTTTIYPHEPQNQWHESLKTLSQLVTKHDVSLVTIGNGTACRESEKLIAELIKEYHPDLQYLVTNEAGASVYSASELAGQELPDLDVSMRGAVSIARRVLDPLAELVKIEPRSIGVGLYQHDVNQKALTKTLGEVVESCVNYVGVELNSASPALLRYVSGLSPSVSEAIVAHRQAIGEFQSRAQLKEVKGLGAKTFQQCAGFLRIAKADDPLDNTAVHPESYDLAKQILAKIGYQPEDLNTKLTEIKDMLATLDPAAIAKELEAGEPTVRDIISSLAQPGRDPRDELPAPLFRADVLSLKDLKPGMILQGSVQNVVDFGAFVDIGVEKAGLVHISEISEKYISHPTDVLQVGDAVTVQVLSVDLKQERIGLTMKIRQIEQE